MLNEFINIDLQKIHPLTKLICTFIFVLILAFTHSLGILLFLIILISLMILWSKISLKSYFDKINKLKLYFILIFLVNLLLSWSITFSFIEFIKFILLVLYLLILNFTTSFTDIVYCLKWLLRPFKKFKSDDLALDIALALNFILIFTEEYDKILCNYEGKGYKYRKDCFTYFKYIVIPNFKLTFRRMGKLKKNIYLKLYDYSNKYYNFKSNVWNNFDKYIVIMHGFVLLIVILKGVLL